jgi:hypothetical protein
VDLLHVLSASSALWASEVEVLDDLAKVQLGGWLVTEWIEGRLEPRLLRTDADDAVCRALRCDIAATVTALGMDDVETEWYDDTFDAVDAARWCWVRPWSLMSQDEDLLLMKDELVAPLLCEASADCPKRDYAIHIVEHHVRDRAYAALAVNAEQSRERWRTLGRFRPSAVAARADELVAYLDRLESYVQIRKVTMEDARHRILDLSRCYQPASVTIERRGAEWWSPIDRHPLTEQWIVIDQQTGAARVESPGLARMKAKGRHNAPR